MLLIPLFFKGFMLGLSIATLLNPLLTLNAYITLNQGMTVGFFAGLGATTIDAFYSLIAGFGINALSNLIMQQQNVLTLVSGLFLGYFGIKIVLFSQEGKQTTIQNNDYLYAYIMMLLVALASPLTIFSLFNIFSNLGVMQAAESYLSAMSLIGGIFIGSLLTRSILNIGLGFLAKQLPLQTNLILKKILGIVIVGFGFFSFLNFLS